MAQQINLYRARLARKSASLPSLGLLKLGIGVVVIVTLLSVLSVWRTRALQSEIAALEQEQAGTRMTLEEAGRRFGSQSLDAHVAGETAKLRALIAAPQSIRELLEKDSFLGKQGYSEFFIALARQSVQGVQLTRVDITGAGKEIEIFGRATAPERVPRYLQRLSREKIMEGLEFSVFQISQPTPSAEEAATEAKPPAAGPRELTFILRTRQPVQEPKS